jgi:hypothetical protein
MEGLAIPRHHDLRTRLGDTWAHSIGDALPPVRCDKCGEQGHYSSDCRGAPW